jgi:hypothetical protein
MSRRTFDRRFRSLTGSAPLQWLITQRVLQAQRLLETSDYSVDEVAGRCGFRSPVALRGHFRRQLGSSPAAYRAAYRVRRPDVGNGTMTGNDEGVRTEDTATTGDPGNSLIGNGDDHGMMSAPGPYSPRDIRDATRAHREPRHHTTEPGKPESDAWAARVPGQRGRG